MRVEVLGRVRIGGVGPAAVEVRGAGPAQLVAALALEHPRPLARSELVDALWPDEQPQDAAHALRQVVSRARSVVVGAGGTKAMLVSHDGLTSFEVDSLSVDLLDAIRDVEAADRLLADGDPAGAAVLASDAAAVLEPGLFPCDQPAFVIWRERAVTSLARARRIAARGALDSGRPDDAADLAQRVLVDDPFDEQALRTRMRALAATGRAAAALAEYERARRALADELGVRPTAATEQLYVELLGGDVAPVRPVVDAAPITVPVESHDVLAFVGREHELGRLAEQWHTVRALGVQQIAIVYGPAGIGKTRLVAEMVDSLRSDVSVAVSWGRCHVDGVIPFEPFGQLLTQIVAARPAVVSSMGRRLDDLALVVPDIQGSAPVAETSDDRTRGRVFGAVLAATRAAAAAPLVVVVDDVQWAGADALSLLVQVIDATVDMPVFMVLIERDATGPAASVLGELRRRASVASLRIDGLVADDIAALIVKSDVSVLAAAGDEIDDVAAQLVRRTAGNALFVTQFVREAQLRAAPIDVDGLPPALAEILGARIATVPRSARAVLDLAAVAGSAVPVGLLARCASRDYDEVLDALDLLVAARLLSSSDPDHVHFTHDLIRDAVLATVTPPRQARLHEQIGDALAVLGADAERVAHHLRNGGGRCAAGAARWSVAAGASALRRGAWASAEREFTLARDLAPDADRRCAALIGLGRAQRALGRVGDAGATLRHAIAIARAHGLGERAAEATLALVGGGGRGVALELADGERAELLRAAHAGLTPESTSLRVAVLGELALALVLTDSAAEREALCAECIATARRAPNVSDLATALQTRRIALMGPAGTLARRGDGDELLALPAELVDPDQRIAAHLSRMEDLLELGDRDGSRRALRDAEDLVAHYPHPYWSWAAGSWAVLDALIDGRFDEAEPMAYEAFAHQASSDHPEAIAALGVQLTDLRLFQGRAHEMTALLADAADANPHIPCYRAVLALCHAESGAMHDAGLAFDRLAAAGSSFGLPVDTNWMLAVAVLGDVAASLGRIDEAGALGELLLPYSDRHVVLNCYGGGGAYWGPVALVLARLATTRGAIDEARSWQQRALTLATQFGAPWFVARAEALGEHLRRA